MKFIARERKNSFTKNDVINAENLMLLIFQKFLVHKWSFDLYFQVQTCSRKLYTVDPN